MSKIKIIRENRTANNTVINKNEIEIESKSLKSCERLADKYADS